MNNIIFKKIEKNIIAISKEEILKSIPDKTVICKDIEKSKTKTEMRWRLYKFSIKGSDIEKIEKIEISLKYPNKSRLYINKNGSWVEMIIEPFYKKFMVEEYYHYFDD